MSVLGGCVPPVFGVKSWTHGPDDKLKNCARDPQQNTDVNRSQLPGVGTGSPPPIVTLLSGNRSPNFAL